MLKSVFMNINLETQLSNTVYEYQSLVQDAIKSEEISQKVRTSKREESNKPKKREGKIKNLKKL